MNLNRLDLNLLVALDALLEARSITQAAERLHLSPSATSGALARLRTFFNEELLTQIGRRMAPTPLGESLKDSVRDCLLHVRATVVNAAQLANQHVYTIADLARTTPALEMVQAFGGPGGGGQIDLTESGDANLTLRASDPILRGFEGRSNAAAYADAKDLKNPHASPVYGDFSKGYPPTLIQAGTRELLLSDAVRAYQALDRAHRTVRLDVYEAMPHVFQALLPESDESRTAIRKTVQFFKENLQ